MEVISRKVWRSELGYAKLTTGFIYRRAAIMCYCFVGSDGGREVHVLVKSQSKSLSFVSLRVWVVSPCRQPC